MFPVQRGLRNAFLELKHEDRRRQRRGVGWLWDKGAAHRLAVSSVGRGLRQLRRGANCAALGFLSGLGGVGRGSWTKKAVRYWNLLLPRPHQLLEGNVF